MRIKVKILWLLCFVAILNGCNEDEDFPDIVDIPDTNFLRALIEAGLDTNEDSAISIYEVQYVRVLDVSGKNINDLTGIESFKNLRELDVSINELKVVDVSKNTTLLFLNCVGNKINTLDLSKNIQLEELWCFSSELFTLDLSKNVNLEMILCDDNPFSELNCSNLPSLRYLRCHNTHLKNLKITNCKNLELIFCHDDSRYGGFTQQLTDLDFSGCTNLAHLFCYGNKLTSLNVTDCINLETLELDENPLEMIDLSNNTMLRNISLRDMPTLSKVCVWKMPISSNKVIVDTSGSPNVYFTTDCSK